MLHLQTGLLIHVLRAMLLHQPSRIPVGGLLLHPQSMEKNLLITLALILSPTISTSTLSVADLVSLSSFRHFISLDPTNNTESEIEKEAWRLLKWAVVTYYDNPVVMLAANDTEDKKSAFNSDTLIGLVTVNITFQLIRGSMKQFNWDIDPMLVQFNEYVKYAVIECYESLKPEVEFC
ncbi:hypothetical protein L2E82_28586 [Cichorium intybus]|uniref:Uncharacterized protein n=1 Tax=Cichorium intybus TaxID=13427 RepID=A0ACB9CWC3_CICIN|nr:hypothetical protein L2E82_28586 [Cichorium intybus]